MRFTPKSEAELDAEAAKRGAWAPGVYDAEIFTATEAVSAKGNDMIAMVVNVFHPDDGGQKQVKDWLLEAMAYKLRHCCCAAGLTDAYEAGTLEAWQLEGKPVKVKLGTEAYKTDDGRAGTKNKIVDYVVSSDAAHVRPAAPRAAAKSAPSDPFGEDIPF